MWKDIGARPPVLNLITTHGGGTSRKRMHAAADYSGAEIMRVLRDEVQNRKIPVVDFTSAIEIIKDTEGKAAGGVHGRNRLMGNSLLDVIVFGRNAGQEAGKQFKNVTLSDLTLEHVDSFEKECEAAGIHTDEVSPKILPDYRRKK